MGCKMQYRRDSFLGIRLREARESNGFTITELAERTDISKQAISQFESGKNLPSGETLTRLSFALQFPIHFFSKEKNQNLSEQSSPIFFRSFASSTKQNREKAKVKEVWFAEIINYFKSYVNFPKPNLPDFNIDPLESSEDDIEEIALSVRKFWGLGNGPISNLIRLLEANGIFVSRINVANEIDAFSLWRKDNPIIILGTSKTSSVRSRFDAAHELGHLILHRNLSEDVQKDKLLLKKIESQADRFSSAFLMPYDTFPRELISLNLEYLQSLKSRWLVSMQSMIMRAFQLNIISENQKSYFFRNFSRYRKKEPLDDKIPFETPLLLSKTIQKIIESNLLTGNRIYEDLSLRLNDLSELTNTDKNLFIDAQNLNNLIQLKP